MTLDSQGIPGPALAAYHRAAGVIGNADPACHIDWALIAAIGRVESDHGRYGGNTLDYSGIARPGIYGIPLDGRAGTAQHLGHGQRGLDHDTVWDRAVGPMQFIPGTWRAVGGDLDGDGARNPQDINDASAATAIYLCAGPGNLAQAADAYSAVALQQLRQLRPHGAGDRRCLPPRRDHAAAVQPAGRQRVVERVVERRAAEAG